jgi:hypothetical protein
MTAGPAAASWASGIFLLSGLFIGVWKFRAMATRPNHQAPYYVDVAHRAAFMYSFASLVLSHLASHSCLGESTVLAAVLVAVFFFASAVVRYLVLGRRESTDNQFTERTFSTGVGMWLLIAGECGAVILLLASFRPR